MTATINPTSELLQSPPPTPTENLIRSCKRAKKMTIKRNQNLRYATQVKDCMISISEMSGPDYLALDLEARNGRRDLKERLEKYHRSLCGCASKSLYRKRTDSREATLITALTCSHRLCNICNMLRATKMRRKWSKFFKNEERNVPVRDGQAHMFEHIPVNTRKVTRLVVDKETGEQVEVSETKSFTSGADLLRNFDFMHLTLTVPHGPDGWNGKKYYAAELLEAFNKMRKAKWWLDMVFGGELSVETTRSVEGGLHIHIHAMILVDKRVSGSRNKLHEHIMQRWNALTVDTTRPESEKIIDGATPEGKIRWEGIRKSLAGCGDNYFNDFMLDLDGRGSTMIGIKSLYYQLKPNEVEERSQKRTFQENGKTFSYCTGRYPQSMVKGVMECLKYHFEPCVLENDDGTLDTEFLKEVLPNIFRQRLYGKFGGFYGVTQLNVAEDPLSLDDMVEDLQDTGSEAFDPKTGLPMEDRDFVYAIADSRNISFAENKPLYYLNRSKIRLTISPDVGMIGAISLLAEWGYRGDGKDDR